MLEIVDLTVVGTVIAAGIFLAILVCLMLGRWLGRRAIARYGAAGVPSISSLEAAVFALLGLLIAFTFSGALSRFDVRRNQAVDEANAIGTAYLRIDLLPSSAQPQIRDTFEELPRFPHCDLPQAAATGRCQKGACPVAVAAGVD